MIAPRWKKLVNDVVIERGRLLLLLVAVTLSLTGVGTVLGAYTVLGREMRRAYLSTRPASATLELEGDVDAALVDRVAHVAGVSAAAAKDVVVARVFFADGTNRPLLLFVVDDFADLRLALLRSVDGAWPPPRQTMLVERTALGLLQARTGTTLRIALPGQPAHDIVVGGVVHDPSLAPATQEREGYGYVDRATYTALGGVGLHELRVAFDDDDDATDVAADLARVEAAALALVDVVEAAGGDVHQIRVPPPKQHPHQRQMQTILVMLLSFAALSLLLSAVLVATSLASMMARQVREIGVMKTLGARRGDVVGLYAVLVVAIGVVAVAVAVPVSAVAASAMAGVIGGILNFDIVDRVVAGWSVVVVVVAGVGLPLVCAAVPVWGAARMPVTAALSAHGAVDVVPGFVARLPPATRNALRRPRRVLLVVSMLAVATSIFLTARNVGASWQRNIDKLDEQRAYDVEVRLRAPADAATVDAVGAVAAVARVEAWGYAPAAVADGRRTDVVRTYPDRGHGSFAVFAPPPSTTLVRLPLLAGRWLDDADRDGDSVVLNQGGFALARKPPLGSAIALSIDGRRSQWRLVGVVEEIGSPGAAYVADAAYARVVGEPPTRLLRVVAKDDADAGADAAARAVDAALAARAVDVDVSLPLSELREAVEGHIGVLLNMLFALALVTGVVGFIALGSTMSVNVLERGRELGVLRAIGATGRVIVGGVVVEGAVVAGAGVVAGVVASLPLSLALDAVIGSLGFMAALPFAVDVVALVVAVVTVVVAGAVAAGLAARGVADGPVSAALLRL